MISGLQIFGYTIALCGMLYFKLGADALKSYFAEGTRRWAEFGSRRPVLRKITVVALVLVTIFVLLGGFAPAYPEYDSYLVGMKNVVGGKA